MRRKRSSQRSTESTSAGWTAMLGAGGGILFPLLSSETYGQAYPERPPAGQGSGLRADGAFARSEFFQALEERV